MFDAYFTYLFKLATKRVETAEKNGVKYTIGLPLVEDFWEAKDKKGKKYVARHYPEKNYCDVDDSIGFDEIEATKTDQGLIFVGRVGNTSKKYTYDYTKRALVACINRVDAFEMFTITYEGNSVSICDNMGTIIVSASRDDLGGMGLQPAQGVKVTPLSFPDGNHLFIEYQRTLYDFSIDENGFVSSIVPKEFAVKKGKARAIGEHPLINAYREILPKA